VRLVSCDDPPSCHFRQTRRCSIRLVCAARPGRVGPPPPPVLSRLGPELLHANKNLLLLKDFEVGDGGKTNSWRGIRGHYEPASLVGSSIVVVNNLGAGRLIRGEESSGMLGCFRTDSPSFSCSPIEQIGGRFQS